MPQGGRGRRRRAARRARWRACCVRSRAAALGASTNRSRSAIVQLTALSGGTNPRHTGKAKLSIDRRFWTHRLSGSWLVVAKPDARATSIGIDELDTGGFESASYGKVVGRRHRRLAHRELRTADRRRANRRCLREVCRTPADESPCCSNLGTGQGWRHVDKSLH